MLWLYPGASGVKTGSTAGSGFCLVATARRGARELAVVVLGGRDEVFSDAAALLNHGFAAYERLQTLVAEGAALGSVRVRGGTVPVVAGERLEALVPVQGSERARAPLHRVAVGGLPPDQRFRGGHACVSASAGATLGRVPVLAADLAAPACAGRVLVGSGRRCRRRRRRRSVQALLD